MRKFFGSESIVSRIVFGAILLVIFTMVFGSTIYAEFARQNTSVVGWGNGYGYGYGYGYGFDGGTFAGYRTTTDEASSTYAYGFGYGYIASGVTYDTTLGYEVTPDEMTTLVQSGIMKPNTANITSTTVVTFNDKVTLTVATGTTITIPSGTTFTAGSAGDFSQLAASGTVVTTDLSNVTVAGALQFGLPNLGLTVNPAITIEVNVGSAYNGQTLTIYRKDAGGSWASTGSTCLVASGVCTFTTTHLSSFATGKAIAGGGGGGSVGGGGGSYTPPVVATSTATTTATTTTVTATTTTATTTVVSAGFKFTKDLTLGSEGAEVIELQKVLIAEGYLTMPKGVSMGYFGALTKAAVIKYQLKNNIKPAAGYVGSITRGVLNASISAIISGDLSSAQLKQLIEVLIQIGVIPADKASIARLIASLM